MNQVLDIDLDCFLSDVVYWPEDERPDPERYVPWSSDRLVAFLQGSCLLSHKKKVPGRIVEEHHEVFHFWRDLLRQGALKAPFEVVHVDAHADLGLGDPSYVHITQELLHLLPHERVDEADGSCRLQEGNFLAYAIACRWISKLTYVFPPRGGSDVPVCHMKNKDPKSGFIQLKRCNPQAVVTKNWPPHEAVQGLEPQVPLEELGLSDFTTSRSFDLVTVAHSPRYTPVTADRLLDVFRSFMEAI